MFRIDNMMLYGALMQMKYQTSAVSSEALIHGMGYNESSWFAETSQCSIRGKTTIANNYVTNIFEKELSFH